MPAAHVVLFEHMSHRWLPVSVVALALVLQGVVALAPHEHGPARTDGPELHELVPVGGEHHCFACVTHVPPVGPKGNGGVVQVTTAVEALAPDQVAAAVVVVTAVFDPRGPPSA